MPITPAMRRLLEKGERRATVDDWIALAVALEVFPTDLLLPDEGDVDLPGYGPRDREEVKFWIGGRLGLVVS